MTLDGPSMSVLPPLPQTSTIFDSSYISSGGTQQPRFLACLRCRSKKAKCDNIEAVCTSCARANTECVRPIERRRKRTRKEMEEAEKGREGDRSSKRPPPPGEVPVTVARPNTIYSKQPRQPKQPHSSGESSTSASRARTATSNNSITDKSSQALQPFPDSSPKDAQQVVDALSQQYAYLEGDPGESSTLTVYYYRYSGRTAIHPGFNKICITLRSPSKENVSSASSPSSIGNSRSALASNVEEEDLSLLPLDESLVDLFFAHFHQHFPFMNQTRVHERLAAGTMSAFLLNAMNALAVRFSPNAKRKPQQYISAAWRLVAPLLRVPSKDVVGGLLLLTWSEFGENSESGLWNFMGLAIRMAIDLGLHKPDQGDAPDDDVCNGFILFWSLYAMDCCLAFGTGRTTTIPDEIVEINMPTEIDMDATRPTPYPTTLSPFVKHVQLFTIGGRIANTMNGSRGQARPLVYTEPPTPQMLHNLHNELVDFLTSMPGELSWSVDNFRRHSALQQGGCFLSLHLWANAILALIHHPNLGRSEGGMETPISAGVHRSIKLSLASSKQIADCLVFADLFDSLSYCSTPFVNQCLFIAGVAFIHDAQNEDLGLGGAQSEFISGLVRQNLSALLKALKRMQLYWGGVAYVIDVLEQRASGRGWAKVDLIISDNQKSSFISLPDTGILRRISKRGAGAHMSSHNPAETFAGFLGEISDSSHVDDWSFESLLSSYQVETVTASAATGFDISGVFPDGFSW